MTHSMLFAASANWVGSWLTPIWLVGVGAILGLAILLVIWLLGWVLSRIPSLSSLADSPRSSLAFGGIAGAILFVIAGTLCLGPSLWGSATTISAANLPMAAILLAFACWIGGFLLAKLLSRRTNSEVVEAVREGPLWPIFLVTCFLAVFGVAGAYVATTPRQLLHSLTRLPVSGHREVSFTIPAAPEEVLNDAGKDPPQHPISITFRQSELQRMVFRSNQNISVDTRESGEVDINPLFRVNSGEDATWTRTSQASLAAQDLVTQLFVRNYGRGEAQLTVALDTAPEHPEAATTALTAISVVGIFLLYFLQRLWLPRLSAVALAAYKSEIAQPLFLIVMAIGIFAVVAFIWIPYNTLGEDIKVLKDTGMTLIMILAIIQAVWAASTSVADEIEGRTALTVLSKPIGRRSFIGGKFMGIFWTVAVIFIVLGASFMVSVSYKPLYDSREGAYKPLYEGRVIGDEDVTWQQCHYEMVGVVPGLLLAFLETVVLAALAVAISTRLPMLANFIICFAVYVMGHLTPLIVQSSVGKFPPVRFVAELLSTVLPILDHFNIQAAVATGLQVPYDYLGWTLVYSLLYGFVALLLALVLFEDRDLA